MESESQNTKTSLRQSPSEDILSESQDDQLSNHGSKSSHGQTQHTSLSDIDRDLYDSEQESKSLPVHQSFDSSRERPVSFVSPLVTEPRPGWSDEEQEARTSPMSEAPDGVVQHEDDREDTLNPPLLEYDTGSPILLASDNDADKSDTPKEYPSSLEHDVAPADQLEVDDNRFNVSSKSGDITVYECDSSHNYASPIVEDTTESVDSTKNDFSSSEVEAERPFRVSRNTAFVPVSQRKEATSEVESFAKDTGDLVPTPLDAPQPSVKSPTSEKIMTTKHGIRVKVYVGDITKANAEAVVTSDNPHSNDMSMVTRALCQSPGGSEFEEKRDRRRLTKSRPLTNGKVYTVHIKNQEFPFTYVLQAIISPYDTSKIRPGTWKKTLKGLYKNIYKKTDMKDITSVAVPLLGTGRGHGSAEESVEAAIRTLCKHRPLSLEEVQFVSLDRGVNDYLAAICESCCNISDESSSDEAVTEETVDEEATQTGSSTGALQTKPVSVSVSANLSKEKGYTMYNYSSEPDNILLTPPATGTPSAVSLSSALPEETSRPLTRAERMQKLMSDAGETQDTQPISSMSDNALNFIPEVKSSLSYMTFESSHKKTVAISAELTEVDGNEPDNIIEESRNSYFSEPGGVPVTKFDPSSKDNDLLETYCGKVRSGKPLTISGKGQNSQTFWQPSTFPSDNSEGDGAPEFDEFEAGQQGFVYYGRDTAPDYWQYPDDKRVEYGSDDDDYNQKCADAEDEFEPMIDANLVQTGNQPPGTMSVTTFDHTHLPGYEDVGTIVITYQIPSGHQTEDHPHPGRRYQGVHRRAFLPDNEAGRMVMRMLKVAFERRLVFTVGRSLTTGQSDVVRWGPISHKTSQDGGAFRYGYPDIDYLNLVTNELLNLGIVDTSSDVVDDMNSLLVDDADQVVNPEV